MCGIAATFILAQADTALAEAFPPSEFLEGQACSAPDEEQAWAAPSTRPQVLALYAALRAMHHRGPDAWGVHTSIDGQATLGHVRLALVAPHNGAQPLRNEADTVSMVVSGEFYGHRAQRAELEARGHCFATASDSEVALHLYEDLGPAAFAHLRGEFALILYDARRRRVLAVRDRFGVRPLVWTLHQGQVLVASEVKALFAMGVPRRWDPQSFFTAATLQYVLPHKTLFEGISQVPPGHYLEVGPEGPHLVRWFALEHGPGRVDASPDPGSLETPQQRATAAHKLGEALREAVSLRLEAEAPVCCHLSGGLDSGAVLALASQGTTSPPPAFSVAFATPEHTELAHSYNEIEAAREMAAWAGAPLHEVHLSPHDLLDALPAAVVASEGLAINSHLAAKYRLNQAIHAAGYRVALTGEGADEVLAGYPHLRLDAALTHPKDRLGDPQQATLAHLTRSHGASRGIMLAAGEALSTAAVQAYLGYVPAFLQAKATLGHKMHRLLHPDLRASQAQYDPFAAWMEVAEAEDALAGRHPLHQSMWLWSRMALANYILRTLGDGCEMAHAVEGRLPFLDPKVVEEARRIPPALLAGLDGPDLDGKTPGGSAPRLEKALLREALGEALPPGLRARPKHPFMAPPAVSTCLDTLLERLHDGSLDACPLLDAAAVRSLALGLRERPAAERAPYDPVLHLALSASHLQAGLGLGLP